MGFEVFLHGFEEVVLRGVVVEQGGGDGGGGFEGFGVCRGVWEEKEKVVS